MLRTAVTGRGAVLTVVAGLSVVALLALGAWQWDRSRPIVDLAALPVVPVTDVIPDEGRLVTADQGRRVEVSGTWRPDRQVLVADRDRPGAREPGRWVVTAVELRPPSDGDPAVVVPVVRGWVAADRTSPAGDVPAPPPGTPAQLTGWVQASEPLDSRADPIQPDGVVALLAAADLVNRWPERVLDGFVILDSTSTSAAQAPADSTSPGRSATDTVGSASEVAGTGPATVGTDASLPGPVDVARGSRDWRNVAYAAQWWVFAGFAIVLWWRTMRDVDRASRATGAVDRAAVPDVRVGSSTTTGGGDR